MNERLKPEYLSEVRGANHRLKTQVNTEYFFSVSYTIIVLYCLWCDQRLHK